MMSHGEDAILGQQGFPSGLRLAWRADWMEGRYAILRNSSQKGGPIATERRVRGGWRSHLLLFTVEIPELNSESLI